MGQKNELRGCINDAKHVRKFLIRMSFNYLVMAMLFDAIYTGQWGYKAGDIVLLTDDARDPRQLPTKKNIQDAMRWLVSGAKCHDALFFHCRLTLIRWFMMLWLIIPRRFRPRRANKGSEWRRD